MKLSINTVSFYLLAVAAADSLRVRGVRELSSTSGASVPSFSGVSVNSNSAFNSNSRELSSIDWGSGSNSRKSPPTPVPTMRPTEPVAAPVATSPTTSPPTNKPTPSPTMRPNPSPTRPPTPGPTNRPTNRPTLRPNPSPTRPPTPGPTNRPTNRPTPRPTPSPTMRPNPAPTRPPTPGPTNRPTPSPTRPPTPQPTNRPTPRPTPRPTAPQGCSMEFYTPEDVAQHPNANSCWYILYGVVYDFTSYINQHPGGAGTVLIGCGRDATTLYASQVNHNRNLLQTGGFSSMIVGRFGARRETGTVPCDEVNLVAVT